MNAGRDDIVTGLPKIHMVIWMGRSIDSLLASKEFIGPVGDDFIGIHVGGGPRAGLKDVQNKLLIPSTLHYLIRSLLNRFGDLFF